MTDFLAEISEHTKQRLRAEKSPATLQQVRTRLRSIPPARPFAAALRAGPGLGIIAELKQASPSAGVIRKEADLPKRLQAYASGGAAALSILTEEHYFHGSTQVLEAARKASPLPLLRKDFILDAYQVDETRGLGADAVLLIAALVTRTQLRDLADQAQGVGLETLIEVHDESELEQVVDAGFSLIGINNRDLRSLRVDTTTAKRLLPRLAGVACTVVVESGIKEPSQLREFRGLGAHAILIGEALMREADPARAVQAFVEAGRT